LHEIDFSEKIKLSINMPFTLGEGKGFSRFCGQLHKNESGK